MVCGVIKIDDKQLMSFVRTQNIQAHSSGEAEYYGQTSVGVEVLLVLLMFRIFSWLGYPMRMEIQSDSTAAIGICHRKGVGRIKQLEVKTWWLQNFTAGRGVEQIHQVKEHTSQMCADLGTKKQTAEKISVLRSLCGYREFKDELVKVKPTLMDTPMARALGLVPIPAVGGISKVPAKSMILAGLLALVQQGESASQIVFAQ